MAAKKRQSPTHSDQEKYVAAQRAKGSGTGIVFADAFLRGMRDIGYRDTAWALCEQADNSIEAEASVFAIRFGYLKKNHNKKKPDMIAVIDNGIGMIPEMIGFSVRWGGTHRESSRKGFGRYGYGLPSSAINFCRKYTVYSRTKGGQWWAVMVDIEQLAEVAGQQDKIEELLAPQPKNPPDWTTTATDGFDPAKSDSGTIVVHEDLDRLSWKTSAYLESKLCQHFGTVYRRQIPDVKFLVGDTLVQAVDPLFLTPHGKHFSRDPNVRDKDTSQKVQVDPVVHEFTDESGVTRSGVVRIRASYLPCTFQRETPDIHRTKGKVHPRFQIMKDNHGVIICRNGRQIDVVMPKFTKFQNNDHNIKIELDFDPELDSCFGITTSKQQITIDADLWQRLTNKPPGGAGLRDLVADMRDKFDDDRNAHDAVHKNQTSKDSSRPSEFVMAETERLKPRKHHPTEKQMQQAEAALDSTAATISETTGKPHEDVRTDLEERGEKKPYEVEFKSMEEGVFFLPKRLGKQKRLIINSAHPFFTKLYGRSPDSQSALEVLLFVLAEAELEVGSEEFADFYKSARHAWSERLAMALDQLTTDEELRDIASAVSERLEVVSAIEEPNDSA